MNAVIGKTIKVLILLFLAIPSTSFALQKPVWVSTYGNQMPFDKNLYMSGFGMASISANETLDAAIQIAETGARDDLVQKVRVMIQSESSMYREETNDSFSSQYVSATSSTARLELSGLNSRNYVDRREGIVYALAYVSRQSVIEQYENQLQEFLRSFNAMVDSGTANFESGNMERAFNQFSEAKSVYTQLMDTWSVLRSVKREMDQSQPVWSPEDSRQQLEKVDQSIERILNRPVNSLDDAAWWLAHTMGAAAEEDYRVAISAITYRDSGISSEFANYMRQLLNRQLNNQTRWHIEQTGPLAETNPDHILTGTFWNRGDDVHLLLNVRKAESGRIVAATEVGIPGSVVEQSGLELLPENYEQAMADLKALQNNEGDSRGLRLSAWTNRGENNLVFEEGDIMEVSLQINLPSYIRILYHLKDGRRVLLLDSHYINPRDVNRPYRLPYRFQAVPPFGVESMQVIAQSEPFERVQTRDVDGLPILAEDIETFLSNTRGFVLVKEEAQQTEQILTITTMPKAN